jgi:uncharacterized membrane protein YwaF
MNKQMRYSLIVAIVMGWILFYSKVVIDGQFRMDFYLPAELCNMMQFMIVFAVMTNKVKILDMLIYPSILGPVAALTHPFGIATFGPFYLCYFLFYHLTLVFVGVYRLIQRKGNMNTSDLTHSIAFMTICALIATIVNLLTGGNYMFIAKAIFQTPINYQVFLVLFTIGCVSAFHLIIVMSRSLVTIGKIKYRKKRASSL